MHPRADSRANSGEHILLLPPLAPYLFPSDILVAPSANRYFSWTLVSRDDGHYTPRLGCQDSAARPGSERCNDPVPLPSNQSMSELAAPLPDKAVQRKGHVILGVLYPVIVLTSLFVAGRLFSRRRKLGRWAVDDYIILACLVCIPALCACPLHIAGSAA